MISAKSSLNRATLKGGAATFVIAILAIPGAALAQAVPTPETVATSTDEGTIVVTGSLIRNPNLVSASPVTVTTADTIQLRASNVAEEVLRDIPGVVPSIGSAVNNGNGGASFVDLRGIGANRNIVLLDGNRIAPAGIDGIVDLNNVPLALVERVDALTGAAVTTYGADAISGVVNFVTKQDFSGVDLQLGTGLTEAGDGATYRADLTIGGNFDEGRGNAVLSVGYQKADPVYQGARDFSIFGLSTYTGGASGSGTAIPSRFTGVRPIDPVTGLPSTNPATANGNLQIDPTTGTARALYAPFNFNPYNIFQTPFERFNIYGAAKYDVSDALQFYTRGMFSKNTVQSIVAPSGAFGTPVTINLNNPFLPGGLRNQFCAANVGATGTYQAQFTPAECAAAATATGVDDPNYRTVDTALARRTTELGPRVSDFSTTLFDYRAGLKGKITDSIDWDLSGSYGESENRQTLQGYALASRVASSLLVDGTAANPVCQSGDAACVPINWFGPAGSISQAGADYLTGESTTTNRTSLAQVRGIVSGDIGVASPGATDAIGFAIGGEYRKYRAEQRSDILAQTPGELGGAGGAAPNITGGYEVKEVYGELIVPLIQDKPFFENLTLEGGARYSDYKVDAPGDPSYDTFTWKAGGTWEMIQGLKVRGNYSRAVRAPNIGELFSPQSTFLTNLSTDPCAGAAPLGNANLRAVCLAQGAPSTSIGGIENPTAGQANATGGGNILLQPETANTWTVGAVFQPTFVPGLALTVDYYNITVKDAVSSPLPGDAVAACFGNLSAASAASPACLAIRRNPATGGLDGDASTTPGLFLASSNLGRIETDGLDVTLSYSNDLGFAKLGVTGNFNYTFHSKFNADVTAAGGGVSRECVGYYSVNCSFTGSLQPQWQSSLRTTLGFNDFDVSLLWRHIDGLEQEPLDVIQSGSYLPAFAEIGASNYFDVSGRVSIMENISMVLTVTNIGNRKPPIVGANAGSTTFNSGNTYPSTYDALGRRYAMQVNLKF